MLYESTRSKGVTFSALRALKDERAPDGGFYVPAALPYYAPKPLGLLLQEETGEIIIRILNDFFDVKLGQPDLKFALGSRFFGLARINHRIIIGELWRNSEWSFDGVCRRLAERMSPELAIQAPGMWMRIACRIALVFAMYARLQSAGVIEEGEKVDMAVLTGDFEGPYALWAARKMGLPIGQIVCCCNENSGVWDLFNRGQIKLNARTIQTQTPKCDRAAPPALEMLIHGTLEQADLQEYLEVLERGGTYFVPMDRCQRIQEGFSASVVNGGRAKLAIPNLFSTNGYILCPYSALVYTGLLDYRSRPGPRRAALMVTDYDPRDSADTVTRALAISDRELRRWCQHG